MKNDNEVIRYLSGMMNKTEENEFIHKLNNSTILREEFDKMQAELNCIKNLDNPKIDGKYFINLRVKVKERMDERKKKFIPKFASALALSVIIIVFLSKLFVPSEGNITDKEQISWDEYFASSQDNEELPFDVVFSEDIEAYTTEERLNYVHKINAVQSNDFLLSLPELDTKTISELESKKIL